MKNLREGDQDRKVQKSSAADIFKAHVLGNIRKFLEVFLVVISGIRGTTRIEQLGTKNVGQHPTMHRVSPTTVAWIQACNVIVGSPRVSRSGVQP